MKNVVVLLLFLISSCNSSSVYKNEQLPFKNSINNLVLSYMKTKSGSKNYIYLVFVNRDSIGNSVIILAKSTSSTYLSRNVPSEVLSMNDKYLFIYNGMENIMKQNSLTLSRYNYALENLSCDDCVNHYIESQKWRIYSAYKNVKLDTAWKKMPQIPELDNNPPPPKMSY